MATHQMGEREYPAERTPGDDLLDHALESTRQLHETLDKAGCMIVRKDEFNSLRELLEQMLNVAENADETGYVADCGFVDIDKLHEKVRAALKTE